MKIFNRIILICAIGIGLALGIFSGITTKHRNDYNKIKYEYSSHCECDEYYDMHHGDINYEHKPNKNYKKRSNNSTDDAILYNMMASPSKTPGLLPGISY